MIELIGVNSSGSYETIGQYGRNSDSINEEAQEGGRGDENSSPNDEQTVILISSTDATVEHEEETAFEGYVHPQELARDVSSLDRCFLNLLGICFLLFLSYAFAGNTFILIPFMPNMPEAPSYPTPHPIHPNDELSHFHSRRPTVAPVPRSPPPMIETCRPPSVQDNGTTAPFRRIYHNRTKSLLKTKDVIGKVHLSGDASIMVWRVPNYPSNRCSKHCRRGLIRTFGWDCESDTYKRIGHDLLGKGGQKLGMDAQLSHNGDILMVKSHRDIFDVYHWKNYQWIQMVDPISALQSSCFQPSSYRLPNLKTFSITKKGTAFAVMTEYFDSHINVAVYRRDDEVWNSTDYKFNLIHSECLGEIGISMSDDEIITLYGLNLGIERGRLDGNMIVPMYEPAVKVVTSSDLLPSAGKYYDVGFSASIDGDSALYSVHAASREENFHDVVLIEYRDGEWITLYNESQTGYSWDSPQISLTDKVAMIQTYGSVILLALQNNKWEVLPCSPICNETDLGIVELSGNGSFLASFDKNHFYLHSIERAI